VARKPSRFNPAADREAAREFRYYERAAGLGFAFLEALDAALTRACEAPNARRAVGVLHDESVRSSRLHRFPLRLLFVDRPDEIRVIAVAHISRRPGYWKRRRA
jgi:hypothetical protein